MASKPTAKSKSSKRPSKKEQQVFVQSLENSGQLQEAGKPLKPGATHVVTTGEDGEVRVERKRFSAT